MSTPLGYNSDMAARHPSGVIEEALAYARAHGWLVIKSKGGSAHAWGVMRCPGDCPQVSIFSTPRVPTTTPVRCGGSWTVVRTLVRRGPMAEHNFELMIRGELDDDRLDALYEAGCDDATFSSKDGIITAEFDRGGPSLFDAVISAIEAVESVGGLEVLQVSPDELVWASEIASRTGRTRQSIDQLIKAKRGPGGFPAPASHATRNPLWRWSEVEVWFSAYDGREVDPERSVALSAINGALQARHSLRAAPEANRLRKSLQHLLAS